MPNDDILVTRPSIPEMKEYIEEIREIWNNCWLTNMGPEHQKFQQKLKEYLNVNNIDLLVNGHMALELSIQALNIHGDIITTPFTFASTTHAIVRNGLKPVFCDINPIDFTINASSIEELITDRTCAILPVHVYGNVCNVEEIERIAQKYGLKVIYDAAHAFGVKYKENSIGNFGDVSCFSFHATKVFNSIEGGAVCFGDEDFGRELYRLKNFGIKGPEIVDGIGANAKMNEFSAAMGICNLRHIDTEIQKRKQIADYYRMYLEGIDGIQLNPIQENVIPNFAYFPVVFDEKIFGASRNEVYTKLEQNRIFTRKYFFPLTSTFECFHGKYNAQQTPVALHISKRVLTLPIYANLKIQDVDRICNIILECKR